MPEDQLWDDEGDEYMTNSMKHTEQARLALQNACKHEHILEAERLLRKKYGTAANAPNGM